MQKKIALALDISPRYFNDIVCCRRGVGTALAHRLEKLTGIDKLIWVFGNEEIIRRCLDEQFPSKKVSAP